MYLCDSHLYLEYFACMKTKVLLTPRKPQMEDLEEIRYFRDFQQDFSASELKGLG